MARMAQAVEAMNTRKHSRTTVREIQTLMAQGKSLRQISAELNCSPQGLRQACSLLEELNEETRPQFSREVAAHNPWGLRA